MISEEFAVELIDALVNRVLDASDEDCADRARQKLLNRLDQWDKRRKHLADLRKSLVYEKVADDSRQDTLMMSAENAKSRTDGRDAPPFVVANSMREVQPEINLLVSPIKENLVYLAPPGAPQVGTARGERDVMTDETRFVYDAANAVDPLGDAEKEAEKATKHNRAKVGSGRPSSLLYTYGSGSIMDLPQFTIMPTGLDDWDRIWRRRNGIPQIRAPRLREVVARLLRSRDVQLRPHPWQPKKISLSTEGNDLGVPARVFPQWLRCTGCDMLGMLSQFYYTNTHPFRTDLACFEHAKCTGRAGSGSRKATSRTAVPARYLLACVDGHLDEFPYDLWVHYGKPCSQAEFPALKMVDRTAGKGASAIIRCESCGQRRPMNEAQGEAGRAKLPDCRGRHPHLDAFEPKGCRNKTRLILVGASNLWFPATQSIIVMPESQQERTSDLANQIRVALGDKLAKYRDDLETLRDVLDGKVDVSEVSDDHLSHAVAAATAPAESADDQEEWIRNWDPVDLLVPEWRYLQKDPSAFATRTRPAA